MRCINKKKHTHTNTPSNKDITPIQYSTNTLNANEKNIMQHVFLFSFSCLFLHYSNTENHKVIRVCFHNFMGGTLWFFSPPELALGASLSQLFKVFKEAKLLYLLPERTLSRVSQKKKERKNPPPCLKYLFVNKTLNQIPRSLAELFQDIHCSQRENGAGSP